MTNAITNARPYQGKDGSSPQGNARRNFLLATSLTGAKTIRKKVLNENWETNGSD